MRIRYMIGAALAACTTFLLSATVALAQVFTVTATELNVRRGPGVTYPVTFILRRGDIVEVIRRQGEWAFVVGARGGEGWVFGDYLATRDPQPVPPPVEENANQVFQGRGTIDNARFVGAGDGNFVINPNGNASLSLFNAGQFSVEYIGRLRSNFEGTLELDVSQFRSSEMGFRTVPASGSCNVQTSEGVNLVRVFCTVSGNGIDHGRSNFTAR